MEAKFTTNALNLERWDEMKTTPNPTSTDLLLSHSSEFSRTSFQFLVNTAFLAFPPNTFFFFFYLLSSCLRKFDTFPRPTLKLPSWPLLAGGSQTLGFPLGSCYYIRPLFNHLILPTCLYSIPTVFLVSIPPLMLMYGNT